MNKFQREAISRLSGKDRDNIRDRLISLRSDGISKDLKMLALEWGVGEDLLKQIEGEPRYVESIIRKLNTKLVSDGVLPKLYDKLIELALDEGNISSIKELMRILEKKSEIQTEKPKPEIPINDRGDIDENAIALRQQEITEKGTLDTAETGSC